MTSSEKNTYVKKQIRNTLIKMLENKNISDISVRDLCNKAEVGRASFYRNYATKEDVVKECAIALIHEWEKEFESDPSSNFFNVFGSLFAHYQKNKEFYAMLHHQNMIYLMLDTFKKKVGLAAELPNQEAYQKAFFVYGLYGWILEWIGRGMTESPEEINQLLFQNRINEPK